MGSAFFTLYTGDRRIPPKAWVPLTRLIQKLEDFYQLFALAVFIEARLQQTQPGNVQVTGPGVGWKAGNTQTADETLRRLLYDFSEREILLEALWDYRLWWFEDSVSDREKRSKIDRALALLDGG